MPTQEEINKIKAVLSPERFEAYRFQGETDENALARSKWNTSLSEAIYPSLQALEVGFRNRIHQAIAGFAGGENWILDPKFLSGSEQEMVADAKEFLTVRNKPVTPGYLVAELKFGFWTSLADSRYDKIWHKTIKSIFPAMPNVIRNRPEISKRLNSVRQLRNAVSHHHSVWHWSDLEQPYEDIHTLLEWMEPDYAKWVKLHDRFPGVLAEGPLKFL